MAERDIFDKQWVADAADTFYLTTSDPETGRDIQEVLEISFELTQTDQARLANFLERIPTTIIPLLRKYAAAGDEEAIKLLDDFTIGRQPA